MLTLPRQSIVARPPTLPLPSGLLHAAKMDSGAVLSGRLPFAHLWDRPGPSGCPPSGAIFMHYPGRFQEGQPSGRAMDLLKDRQAVATAIYNRDPDKAEQTSREEIAHSKERILDVLRNKWEKDFTMSQISW